MKRRNTSKQEEGQKVEMGGMDGWTQRTHLHMCMYPWHRSYDASARTEGQEKGNPPQFLFNMQLFLPSLRQSIMSV